MGLGCHAAPQFQHCVSIWTVRALLVRRKSHHSVFFLFGILSIELKRKAPAAHTMCEVILYGWGRAAHKVFLGFALVTNVIVTAMLLLGGAAVVTSLTGMNIYADSFLIPVGVILYTLSGGLKATFLASYVHTAIIFAMLVLFVA